MLEHLAVRFWIQSSSPYFGIVKITRVQDALFMLAVEEEVVLIPAQNGRGKLQLIHRKAYHYKATCLQLSDRFKSGQ